MRVRSLALARVHPSVALAWLVGVIACAMLTNQPVCAGIALAGSLACVALFEGLVAAGRQALASLAIVALFALANPFINPLGATVVARPWGVTVTLEALCYGAASGAVLASVFAWFVCWGAVMTSERVLALLGRVAPNGALALCMTIALVPRTIARAGQMWAARGALGLDGGARGLRGRAHVAAQLSGALLGWGMDDALTTAASMRVRGYGSGPRSSYEPMAMTAHDAGLLAWVAAFALVAGLLVGLAGSQFSYYPTMPRLKPLWWGYLPYVALVLLPFVMEVVEWLAWRLSERRA